MQSKRIKEDSFTESLFFSDSEREHFEERAAILEYEAGMERKEAERRALESVIGARVNLRCAV